MRRREQACFKMPNLTAFKIISFIKQGWTISLTNLINRGLFISPSGISELDRATTKTDTAERNISIGRDSLQVFFVLGALAYFQVPTLGGSREEKWCSQ